MRFAGGSVAVLLILAVALLIVPAVSAYEGPRAFLTEQVRADYDTDGSVSSATYAPCNTNPCRYGYVEASVPNNVDVLQYLHVNLSSTTNTNLASATAYRGALASYPNADDRETVYSNCTPSGVWGDPGVYYNITTDAAPPITLKMEWANPAGGDDLYDEDNLHFWGGGASTISENKIMMNATISNPSSTSNLPDVYFGAQFDLDTNGGTDSVNLTEVYAASGSATIVDTDADGYNDLVNWTGDLSTSASVVLHFNFTWEELVNYADGTTNANFDSALSDAGAGANYSNGTHTLTARTIAAKFTRGPIREGVDLAANPGTGVWRVRGFITDIGSTAGKVLTYNVTNWAIYTVNASTGAPLSTANVSGIFAPGEIDSSTGRIYTTDSSRSNNPTWLDTASTSKPYVAARFDWHVLWNSTYPDNHEGYVNTTIDMPILYKIDMVNTQSSFGFISPDTGGENITITVDSQRQGHTNADAYYINIYSEVPANATSGACDGDFDINDIHFYLNGTSYELLNESGVAEVNHQDPASDCSAAGWVNLTIFNLTATNYTTHNNGIEVGRSLQPTELIKLVYNVTTHVSMTTGDQYDFIGNSTMITDSGTPLMEFIPTETVNVSAKRLLGSKDLKGFVPATPSIITADINITVQDGSGAGIGGIMFSDYIPLETAVNLSTLADYNSSAKVYKCTTSSCTLWHEGSDYNITDRGNVTLPDGMVVRAFEFQNVTDSLNQFHLMNDETIWVRYDMNITHEGLYTLPVIIAAFDPLTGEYHSASATGVIAVYFPEPNVPLQITEGDLQLAKSIVVGKSAVWTKQFDIYNPNPRPVPTTFETEVFDDTTDVVVTYTNEFGQQVEEEVMYIKKSGKNYITWTTSMGALESRSYNINILTPPVMEVDRDIEVLGELPDKMVKLKADIFLKSFAAEAYKNVVLNMPTPYENVLEVRDAFGNKLAYTGGAGSTSITIPEIGPEEMMSITVIYSESYPTIIVTPDRDRYNLNAPVNLEVLVVNGGDRVEYPYVELDVYTPHMASIHSNIQKLEDLEPLEKTELFEKFIIPAAAPTGTYITNAKFREDFATLASYTGNFYVVGAGPESNLFNAVGIIVILAIIYLVYRRVRSVKRTAGVTGIAGTR